MKKNEISEQPSFSKQLTVLYGQNVGDQTSVTGHACFRNLQKSSR